MKKYWGVAVLIGLLIGVALWWGTAGGQEEQPEQNIDRTEQMEKERIMNFFSKLRSVYGYLYNAQDESLQLFVKIDEALLEGEVSGSMLVMTNDEGGYKETKYDLNGITDGIMLEFFTTVDGEDIKLEGKFDEDANGFELSFWTTDQRLSFRAVTEEEFKEKYKEYKKD